MNLAEFQKVPVLEVPGRRVLTVVFATDDAYAAPTGAAIRSLLDTVSRDVFCDVVVLDIGIEPESREQLQQLAADDSRASVRMRDVRHLVTGAPVRGHFSRAAYLSLFVPCLFRDHEKVLYLDGDLIVCADISELFDTDFGEKDYLAAAPDIGLAELVRGDAPMVFKDRRTSWRKYAARFFGLDVNSIEQAFNSGVMLYNIPAFTADRFAAMQDLEQHIGFGYFFVDQCVANVVFQGHVKPLHLRWNLQVQQRGTPRLVDWFAQQYREAEDDPAILHYITKDKPWRMCGVPFEDAFWAAAARTVWFQVLQENRLSDGLMRWLNQPVEPPPDALSDEPLFSFIMPVYNREESVRNAIRSIQRQDFTDFEIMVIDDASTDASAVTIQTLADADPRIRLIRLDTNRGPGVARNVGVEQARGKYIGICDSDDFIAPGALAAFARQIAENEYDVIAGNQYRWLSRRQEAAGDNGVSAIRRNVTASSLRDLPEFWTLVHFHRCILRRAFLQEYGLEYPELRRVEDPAYLADVLPKATSFSIMQTPTYLFHVRPRQQNLTAEEIGDAYAGYELIRKQMTAAGYEDIALLFHCFFSPVWLFNSQLSDDELLMLAVCLKQIMEGIPEALLDHPYLRHPQFDAIGFRHDLLVIKHSSPEQIVELQRRNMFCGMDRLHKAELQQFRQTVGQLRESLQRLEPLLRVLRPLRRIARRIARGGSLPGSPRRAGAAPPPGRSLQAVESGAPRLRMLYDEKRF